MRFKFPTKVVEGYEEREVELPRYSRHNFDYGGDLHRKVTAGSSDRLLMVYEIWDNGGRGVELKVGTIDANLKEPDYYLGFGEHQSSEKEWNEALDKAKAILKEIEAA